MPAPHFPLLLLALCAATGLASATNAAPPAECLPLLSASPGQAQSPACRRALVARLHAELDSLQGGGTPTPFPSTSPAASCASLPRVLVFQYRDEEGVNGFAAMFQFHAAALAIAHALNRTLVEALPPPPSSSPSLSAPSAFLRRARQARNDPWTRAPPDVCGGLKHGCFFEPLGPCALVVDDDRDSGGVHPPADPLSSIPLLDPAGTPQDEHRVVRINSLGKYHDLIHAATRGDLAPAWFRAAVGCVPSPSPSPSPLTARPRCPARLWFPAVEAYLFRPLAHIRERSQSAADALVRASPLSFGLHVRRGDAALLPWRSHAGAGDYVAHARAIVVADRAAARGAHVDDGETAGAPCVYVATDSVTARSEASALLGAAGLHLLPSSASILQGMAQADATGPSEVHVHTESYIRHLLAGGDEPSSGEGEGGVGIVAEAAAAAGATTTSTVDVLGVPVLSLGGAAAAAVAGGSPSYRLVPVNTSARTAFAAALRDECATGAGQGASSPGADYCRRLTAATAARELTEGVVADIFVLSHAHYFVGTCLSQVSRLAWELLYASGRDFAGEGEGEGTTLLPASVPVGLDAAACRAFPRHFYSVQADWREGFDVWVDA
jgi:hypothetical protein